MSKKTQAAHDDQPAADQKAPDIYDAIAAQACTAWYQTHAAQTGKVIGPHLVEGHIADIFRGLGDAGMNFFEIAGWIRKAITLYQQLGPQIADVAERIQAIITVIVSLWQDQQPAPQM